MNVGKYFTDLLGKAKETAEDFANQAEVSFDKIKETAAPLFEKTEDFAKETIGKVKDAPEIENSVDFTSELIKNKAATNEIKNNIQGNDQADNV